MPTKDKKTKKTKRSEPQKNAANVIKAKMRQGGQPQNQRDLVPKRHNPIPRGMISALSQDGADWLVQALDPFHDFARRCEGYPDLDSSQTVTQKLTYATTVSAPVGGAAWSAHIFTLPFVGGVDMVNGLFAGAVNVASYNTKTNVMGATAGPVTMNMLNIISAPGAGADLYPVSAAWAPAGIATANMPYSAVAADVYNGYSRIIAAGFEVVNTTPVVSQSGVITTYKQAQHVGETVLHFQDTTTAGGLVDGTVPFKLIKSPPSSVSDALRMPGGAQWPAKDGAYVVIPFNSVENPIVPPTHTGVVIADTPWNDNTWNAVENATGGAAAAEPNFKVKQYYPADTVGLFLTELSPETTFQVRLTVVVEKAPCHFEEMARMATVSPCYDVQALQLYAAIVRDMPIGTPLKNNWGGAWFRMILDKIRAIAGPVASIFGAGKLVDAIHSSSSKFVGEMGTLIPFIP